MTVPPHAAPLFRRQYADVGPYPQCAASTPAAGRGVRCYGRVMATLPESARAVLESAALAHLVTLNEDGSPQVSVVWVGLDGDEIVAGHLPEHKKVRNIRNDGRVALSVETSNRNPIGLTEYLVVNGTARITEGGAPELLQRLARTYLGPDVRFPPMDNPPPGYITHITVDRISGVGPWA
jgi:PPOX class probable F420-dependent enzyme